MWKRALVLAAAFVGLAACTTPMFTMPPGPQAYREGYSDGCSAGYAVAGSPFYKTLDSAAPPRDDDPYRVGWLAGFDRCKQSYQRIQATVSSVLGPP